MVIDRLAKISKLEKKNKSLVIVESPTKARTVSRFLGDEYVVKASMGHVRDLPKRDIGIDVKNNFKPKYVNVDGRKTILSDIKKAALSADHVYLATDPDREGEAISWHLVEAAGLTKTKNLHRVVFHEITRDAINQAFAKPREIDMQLVNAQQARRILDRIVGYRLSPVLWKKVKSGLSAGRVQSVALRLLVDREREIERFKKEEYWLMPVKLSPKQASNSNTIKGNLHKIHGSNGRPKIRNQQEASVISNDLRSSLYKVAKVSHRETRQKPRPPFTTSTLQQQAARSLRYSGQRTMRLAQDLYEGIQIGGSDPTGLITYMRTDSTNLSNSAIDDVMRYIKEAYGDEFYNKPRKYKTKSRNAQEAHEAIRPTDITKTPESLKSFLKKDQLNLYEMIWKRMIASQMADAILDNTTVDISALVPAGKTHTVRVTGSVIKFSGFRQLYLEVKDEDSDDEESRELPPLIEEEQLKLISVDPEQKFTQPPPRFTEANLIRSLEELGIGRPSTYASIISTIEARKYSERIGSRFKPTPVGSAVTDLLTEHFPSIMDTGFTADMESKLDAIADGQLDWIPMLLEFYSPFSERVDQTMEKAPRVDRAKLVEVSDEQCGAGNAMVIRIGRYGKFLSCPNFPQCRVAYPMRPDQKSRGDIIEQREAQRSDAMKGCFGLYPEKAAALAEEANSKARARNRKGRSSGNTKGKRKFRIYQNTNSNQV